jgi:hypothetical protein
MTCTKFYHLRNGSQTPVDVVVFEDITAVVMKVLSSRISAM